MRRYKTNKERIQDEINRRQFMWRAGCASLGVASMASTIWDLRFINAALATTSGPINDYKALVCVFLFGGNDANNLLIPRDGNPSNLYETRYVPQRGGPGVYFGGSLAPGTNTQTLAIPPVGATVSSTNSTNVGMLALNGADASGQTYGLHPACPELQTLFNNTNAAFLANVGTLSFPFPYGADSYFGHNGRSKVPAPPQLFSHNDQQIQWQTSVPDKQTPTGWGGRSADMINAAANGSAPCSMSISLGGQNTFEIGSSVSEYKIGTSGATSPTGSLGSGASSQLQALNDLIGYRPGDAGYSASLDVTTLHQNLYEQSFATTTRNGINLASVVNGATGSISNTDPMFASFNSLYGGSGSLSGLAQQLRMVAKMIKARTTLGHKRQVFFVQTGGYDLHSTQGGATGAHAGLLRDLSKALKGFFDCTVAMANPDGGNYSTQVTSFTVSDFSRTFQINGGMGSDHGWGNHQLIVGGSVLGGQIYGQYTNLLVNGNLDTGTGRWVPTTACDEYFACLARWFGVSTSDIAQTVLPNIGRFANNLAFMGP
jgi:uncharacterized protein (DUF1501 family)